MIKYLIPCVTAMSLFSAPLSAQEKIDLKDTKQKNSYAIGMDIGNNFKRQEIEVDAKALAAGLSDALSGKTQMTEADARQVLNEFRTQLMSKMQDRDKAAGDKNQKEGDAFLAANAKKEGVKTTASGLQYQVIKSGDAKGAHPKATDTVKVHYHGTLIDGSVFDSSIERGEPTEFPVNQVIPGWTEVLQLMRPGDKWKVFIPGKLAYGERSPSPKIGANSTLIFEVELLSIK
jgi:FKBP-type peptidyl-prolyl cis-trans isomerase FklB